MKGKDSRTEEVNRALAARRTLMRRRILRGRIALTVWAILSALNPVLFFGSDKLRLPVSSPSADLCMILYLLSTEDGNAGARWILPAFLLPLLMVLAAILWNRDGVGNLLRKASFLLLWVDVILGLFAYIWNPAMMYGNTTFYTVVAIANLAGHLLLVWLISRARRAVDSLEILPESEYEGDPYEAFRHKEE